MCGRVVLKDACLSLARPSNWKRLASVREMKGNEAGYKVHETGEGGTPALWENWPMALAAPRISKHQAFSRKQVPAAASPSPFSPRSASRTWRRETTPSTPARRLCPSSAPKKPRFSWLQPPARARGPYVASHAELQPRTEHHSTHRLHGPPACPKQGKRAPADRSSPINLVFIRLQVGGWGVSVPLLCPFVLHRSDFQTDLRALHPGAGSQQVGCASSLAPK